MTYRQTLEESPHDTTTSLCHALSLIVIVIFIQYIIMYNHIYIQSVFFSSHLNDLCHILLYTVIVF